MAKFTGECIERVEDVNQRLLSSYSVMQVLCIDAESTKEKLACESSVHQK